MGKAVAYIKPLPEQGSRYYVKEERCGIYAVVDSYDHSISSWETSLRSAVDLADELNGFKDPVRERAVKIFDQIREWAYESTDDMRNDTPYLAGVKEGMILAKLAIKEILELTV